MARRTEPELDTTQQVALAQLLAGATDAEAAQAAGVERNQVVAWLRSDRVFVAAVNTHRQAAWQANADKLRAMTGKALTVLAGAMDSEDPKVATAAAVSVLKAAGLWGGLRPEGAYDPGDYGMTMGGGPFGEYLK